MICLYCLNLPPDLCYKPENVFVVGLIPPYSEPNTTTISHILDPMVMKVLEYQAPGKSVQTHRHLEGVLVQARIVPFIADLPASHKGAGFVSIKGNLLCSFCKCVAPEIEIIDLNRWATHTGAEV